MSDVPEIKTRTRAEILDDFEGGTRTIREWVNHGGVHGPHLVEELEAWLHYWGGHTSPEASAAARTQDNHPQGSGSDPATVSEEGVVDGAKDRSAPDTAELAAAVAAGVEVLVKATPGAWVTTGCVTAGEFRRGLESVDPLRYRVPTVWSWRPEPPAPDEVVAPADDLRERIARVIDDWHNTVEMWTELDDLADAVLAVLPAPPAPPWPGAVLSGLTDEDGVPTWLAQAGQVRGEQVRCSRNLSWVKNNGGYGPGVWVEVRAPRAPETELVQAWEAVKDGRRVVGASEPFEAHYIWRGGPERAFIGERTMDKAVLVAADGTVEVLRRGGES